MLLAVGDHRLLHRHRVGGIQPRRIRSGHETDVVDALEDAEGVDVVVRSEGGEVLVRPARERRGGEVGGKILRGIAPRRRLDGLEAHERVRVVVDDAQIEARMRRIRSRDSGRWWRRPARRSMSNSSDCTVVGVGHVDRDVDPLAEGDTIRGHPTPEEFRLHRLDDLRVGVRCLRQREHRPGDEQRREVRLRRVALDAQRRAYPERGSASRTASAAL